FLLADLRIAKKLYVQAQEDIGAGLACSETKPAGRQLIYALLAAALDKMDDKSNDALARGLESAKNNELKIASSVAGKLTSEGFETAALKSAQEKIAARLQAMSPAKQ